MKSSPTQVLLTSQASSGPLHHTEPILSLLSLAQRGLPSLNFHFRHEKSLPFSAQCPRCPGSHTSTPSGSQGDQTHAHMCYLESYLPPLLSPTANNASETQMRLSFIQRTKEAGTLAPNPKPPMLHVPGALLTRQNEPSLNTTHITHPQAHQICRTSFTIN